MYEKWLYRRYPELLACDSDDARREVFETCAGSSTTKVIIRKWAIWLITMIPISFALLLAVARMGRKPDGLVIVAGMGIAHVLTALIEMLFFLPKHARIRRELLHRGYRICEVCGYDLRGQVAPRCPECGTPSLSPPASTEMR